MKPRMILVCSHCGSQDVYCDAWIGANNPDDILGPYDNSWCTNCDGECSIEPQADYERRKKESRNG